MDIEEAVQILEKHNEWRRKEYSEPFEKMTNPITLGIAIDTVLKEVKKRLEDDEVKK